MAGKRRTSAPVRIWDSFREWTSIRYNRKPRAMTLNVIFLVNVALVLLSAWVISRFALPGTGRIGFFAAVYNTLTMMMDAGCIEAIIEDPAGTNLFLIVFCLVVILCSMVTFTGALIGYVTNVISGLIENANANSQPLRISGHTVLLGWNNRAAEMVNDLLYCPSRQRVVILSNVDPDVIDREIRERLADTIHMENEDLRRRTAGLSRFARMRAMRRGRLKNNITYIVRQGDIFSSIHLSNIKIERARSIVILSSEAIGGAAVAVAEADERAGRSDSRTVKTLMQVIDIASRESSENGQKIVVEINNEWTEELVGKIIRNKQNLGKCRVVPFRVHRAMGQLLCQFSLMPELNMVYRELFSNKGAEFYPRRIKGESEEFFGFAERYMAEHSRAIPLTYIRDDTEGADYCYYMAEDDEMIDVAGKHTDEPCPIELDPGYWLRVRHVLILGSNSKIDNIMNSYAAFCGEWTNAEHPQIVGITIVDDPRKLARNGYYKQYPFVERCVSAGMRDQEKIMEAIGEHIERHPEDSSILILSDDTVRDENIDADALTYLIDVMDTVERIRVAHSGRKPAVEIVVEIIDPKHYDVIRSYDVNNIVISNRYISKMITQISENFPLYNLYTDIMSFDEGGVIGFDSKEVYVKRAGEYFRKLPPPNVRACDLIRSVYRASRRILGYEGDFAILLGYISVGGEMRLFSGDQTKQRVTIGPDDRLLLFSNH